MQKTNWQARITEWMKVGGQCAPSLPVREMDRKTRKLRAKLIIEEALETCNALGVEVFTDTQDPVGTVEMDKLSFIDRPEWVNAEEIVDGCCDTIVVTLGTLSALGVDAEVHMDEVLSANEAKYANGVIRNSDGKIMKPEGWTPPSHGRHLPSFFMEGNACCEESTHPLFVYSSCSDPNWNPDPEPVCGKDCECSIAEKFVCKLKGWFRGS